MQGQGVYTQQLYLDDACMLDPSAIKCGTLQLYQEITKCDDLLGSYHCSSAMIFIVAIGTLV